MGETDSVLVYLAFQRQARYENVFFSLYGVKMYPGGPEIVFYDFFKSLRLVL